MSRWVMGQCRVKVSMVQYSCGLVMRCAISVLFRGLHAASTCQWCTAQPFGL